MSKAMQIILLGLVMWATFLQGRELPPLAVTVRPQQTSYLLGEPAKVTVELINRGGRELRLWQDPLPRGEPYLIRVWWSPDGKQWILYRAGVSEEFKLKPDFQTLPPGSKWEFTIIILYTPLHKSGLLFEAPGRYFLKADYPYRPEGPKGQVAMQALEENVVITSEPVEIQIEGPQGPEAAVWQQLQGANKVFFLHSGQLPWEDQQSLQVAIEVVTEFPQSRYHQPLLEALRRYYKSNEHRLEPEEKQLLRSVLGEK
jgi:hypothetical protein